MQYFCGEEFFRWEQPCNPSELVHFRHRIGEKGMERILASTVELHREEIDQEDEIVADTTVQEADITFPTNRKLQVQIVERLWKYGAEEGMRWKRSYRRTVPKLLALLRSRSNRLAKQRKKAERTLKTLTGRLLREYERKSSPVTLLCRREELELFHRVLEQKRKDKNKVYSLHDPGALCIAKGKVHKKYEFGRKASLAMTARGGVIVAAKSFDRNLYDGDTLPDTLFQVKKLTGRWMRNCLVDRGYRGKTRVGDTTIELPKPIPKGLPPRERAKERKRVARRAAIEPVIGHLKSDHRMARSFLKGSRGASQNVMLAAAGWNLRKWILFVLIWPLMRSFLEYVTASVSSTKTATSGQQHAHAFS